MPTETPSLKEELIRKKISDMAKTVSGVRRPEVAEKPVTKQEFKSSLNPTEIGFDPHLFLADFYQKMSEKLLPKLSKLTDDIDESIDQLSPEQDEVLPGEEKYHFDPGLDKIKGIQDKISSSEIGDFISGYLEEKSFPPEAILICRESLPESVKKYLNENPFRVGIEIAISMRKQLLQIKSYKDLENYHKRANRILLKDFGSNYVQEQIEVNYESFKYKTLRLLGTELGNGNLDLDEVEKALESFSKSSITGENEVDFVEEAKSELGVDDKLNFFAISFSNSLWKKGEEILDSGNLSEIQNYIFKYANLLNNMKNRGYFPERLKVEKEFFAKNICRNLGYEINKDYDSLDSLDANMTKVLSIFNQGYDLALFQEENFHTIINHIDNLLYRKPLDDIPLTKATIHLYEVVLHNCENQTELLALLKKHLDKTIKDWQDFDKSFDQNPDGSELSFNELKNKITKKFEEKTSDN
jgi:hypothetical protein